MSIPFTQFLMPHGDRRLIAIDRPLEIEEMARKIWLAGYQFEIEMLTTGEISMEIVNPRTENVISSGMCPNGPSSGGVAGVPETVDQLVQNAYNKLKHHDNNSKTNHPN